MREEQLESIWAGREHSGPVTEKPVSTGRLRNRNGRVYVEGTSGAFTVDPQGEQVLDFQHFLLRRSLGALHHAPLSAPRRILDVGCGTGRWAADMAAKYPEAQVVGLDLLRPRDVTRMLAALGLPESSVRFVEADILRGLPFPAMSFDFAHMRLMYSELPARAYPDIIRDLARVTRPGGWVECMETAAAPYDPSPAYGTIMAWTVALCLRKGLDANIGTRLTALLSAAGLENLRERVFVSGHTGIHRHERRMELAQMRAALDYWRDPILEAQITTPAEYASVAERARKELEEDRHANADVLHIVCGQRPRHG
jgi:ubiquinone/menaquinone biosynthesis C-methylase UbiE